MVCVCPISAKFVSITLTRQIWFFCGCAGKVHEGLASAVLFKIMPKDSAFRKLDSSNWNSSFLNSVRLPLEKLWTLVRQFAVAVDWSLFIWKNRVFRLSINRWLVKSRYSEMMWKWWIGRAVRDKSRPSDSWSTNLVEDQSYFWFNFSVIYFCARLSRVSLFQPNI